MLLGLLPSGAGGSRAQTAPVDFLVRRRRYDKTYSLKTTLFDAKTEELIWSAQSATYNPGNLDFFLKGYVKSAQKQLLKDGLLANQ